MQDGSHFTLNLKFIRPEIINIYVFSTGLYYYKTIQHVTETSIGLREKTHAL